MLQYRAPLVQLEESGPAQDVPFSAEPSLAEHLATVIGFIRRQFLVIFSVLPLTVGLAVAYLYTTPPSLHRRGENFDRYWKDSGFKPAGFRRKPGQFVDNR